MNTLHFKLLHYGTLKPGVLNPTCAEDMLEERQAILQGIVRNDEAFVLAIQNADFTGKRGGIDNAKRALNKWAKDKHGVTQPATTVQYVYGGAEPRS